MKTTLRVDQNRDTGDVFIVARVNGEDFCRATALAQQWLAGDVPASMTDRAFALALVLGQTVQPVSPELQDQIKGRPLEYVR